ncbi:MAG: phosphogluconate dehydrogenase (NAD(+)-dependent, decarboxylating) [Betaproteobacteria bacterium]
MTAPQAIDFAVIGLGKIGGNLARQALEKGLQVAGFNKSRVADDLIRAGLIEAGSLAELAGTLAAPRIVLLYVPAGKVVDTVLDELVPNLSPGDVVVDGGNSYWGDSVRRQRVLAERSIAFLDVGTSGGVSGARHGACFMAGGEKDAVALAEPILKRLAVEGGYVHAGGPGAGHFVKLVHNGIEFGMLQAIGEGVDLLERYREKLPVADVLRCWRHGSVIRSWLVELMEDAYRKQDGLGRVPGYVEDTGEVNWLIDDALHMEVPIPVIAQSVMQLFTSRDDRRNWARAVAMMRHGFGGHPFGVEENIARERQESRIGGFPRKEEK